MHISDKSVVLDMLRLPRFGLSADQVMDIERIIDGKPPVPCIPPRPWVPYREAAQLLGMKTRQGVKYRIKAGELEAYVPSGKVYAVGVTRASLERALGKEQSHGHES